MVPTKSYAVWNRLPFMIVIDFIFYLPELLVKGYSHRLSTLVSKASQSSKPSLRGREANWLKTGRVLQCKVKAFLARWTHQWSVLTTKWSWSVEFRCCTRSSVLSLGWTWQCQVLLKVISLVGLIVQPPKTILGSLIFFSWDHMDHPLKTRVHVLLKAWGSGG